MPEKDFYQISLKLILLNDAGEILGLGGLPGGSYEGYYDLPGGRIDRDEFEKPLGEIIQRELEEELGKIDVEIDLKPVALGRHLLTKKDEQGEDVHVLYLFFKAKYKGGEIVISPEHISMKWINISEVKLEDYFRSGILEGIRNYVTN